MKNIRTYSDAFRITLEECRKVAVFKNTHVFTELIKYIYANVAYGYKRSEYFMVRGGFDRNLNQIKETVTYKRLLKICKFDDETKYKILLNKVEAYKYFSDFVHHKWIYPRESTYEQFKEFVTNVKGIIQKPLEDMQGHGVKILPPPM